MRLNQSNESGKYLIDDALDKSISDKKYNRIDNYFISYDSTNNILTLELGLDQKLELGTVRMDKTRDSIKYWEFNSIHVIGKQVNIEAHGNEIIELVKKTNPWLSQVEYCLILE